MSNHSPSTYHRTFSAPAKPPVYMKGNLRPKPQQPAAQEPASAASAERDKAAAGGGFLKMPGLTPGMAAFAAGLNMPGTLPAPFAPGPARRYVDLLGKVNPTAAESAELSALAPQLGRDAGQDQQRFQQEGIPAIRAAERELRDKEAKSLQLRGLTPGMAAFAAGLDVPGHASPSVGSGLSPGLAAFAAEIKLPA